MILKLKYFYTALMIFFGIALIVAVNSIFLKCVVGAALLLYLIKDITKKA